MVASTTECSFSFNDMILGFCFWFLFLNLNEESLISMLSIHDWISLDIFSTKLSNLIIGGNKIVAFSGITLENCYNMSESKQIKVMRSGSSFLWRQFSGCNVQWGDWIVLTHDFLWARNLNHLLGLPSLSLPKLFYAQGVDMAGKQQVTKSSELSICDSYFENIQSRKKLPFSLQETLTAAFAEIPASSFPPVPGGKGDCKIFLPLQLVWQTIFLN